MHEASLYEHNYFVTLTYDEDHIHPFWSLKKKDYQDFMKRLRKKKGTGIKQYYCGEYGDRTGRPHFHAILFNCDFDDKQLFTRRDGNELYISDMLNDTWGMGFCTIGNVTFESAAYVARYCMKKLTGPAAQDGYWSWNEDGEIAPVEPEFSHQSNGIGKQWLEKFGSDVYPSGGVLHRGMELKPPRYYDKIWEEQETREFRAVKAARKREASKRAHDNTPDRLRDRRICTEARLKLLPRNLGKEQ